MKVINGKNHMTKGDLVDDLRHYRDDQIVFCLVGGGDSFKKCHVYKTAEDVDETEVYLYLGEQPEERIMTSTELKALRIRLKCGEFDGVDIMKAWIAIDELAKLKEEEEKSSNEQDQRRANMLKGKDYE